MYPLAAVILALTPAPFFMAIAQDAAVSPGPSPTTAAGKIKKAPDPNKRMCRAIESVNSAFPTQVCHTRAEWHALDQASEESASGASDRHAKGLR